MRDAARDVLYAAIVRRKGGAVSRTSGDEKGSHEQTIEAGCRCLRCLLAAAQFIRPDRTNQATDEGRMIGAQVGTRSELVAVLNRACNDCHSNLTVWPWYTEIAPLSWLMAYAVKEGRKAVNFSEWAAYPPARQRILLAESCQDVKADKMPGAYALLHPEMRLSASDVETICAAARQAETPASGVSQ